MDNLSKYYPIVRQSQITSAKAKDRRELMRGLREALNMSLTAFAMVCGIGTGRLHAYESGRTPWQDAVYAKALKAVRAHAVNQQAKIASVLATT